MKYAVFFGKLAVGVPIMAFAGITSSKIRGLLLAALIFSTALGDMVNINFLSMETYRGPDRGFEITLTDLIAWALALAMTVKFSGRIQWFPHNTVLMALLFGWGIISTVLSPAPLLGAFTLFKLFRFYLVYWCVVNVLRIDGNYQAVWQGMVSIAMFLTVLALKQKYVDGIYRIPGPFDHSNTIPLYANLIIPILMIWGLVEKRFGRLASFLSVGGGLGLAFAVVATGSRAGMALALFIICGSLGVAVLRKPSLRSLFTAIIILLAILAGGIKSADTIIYRIKHAPESSKGARDEFNIAAENMAADHVFGVGLNNFSGVLTVDARYNSHIEIMKNEEQAGVCHHIYWLNAAEMGYVGLLLFVGLILRFLWLFARSAIRGKNVEHLLLFGIILGAFALHASGFLEWALRISPVSYQFVITSALGVALSSQARAVRQS